MKLRLLFVVLFVNAILLNAQSNKELADKYLNDRGELAFTFTANNFDEVNELSNIISFERWNDPANPLTIRAIANKKNFSKFLAYNLSYEVSIPANEPKNVEMFNPKIHKKGVSKKSNAYTLTFPLSTYPTYQQYADQMQDFVDDHSAIAQLVDIGGTVQGDKRLLFIKLSNNVNTREAEPRVMYTSSMHGDEIAGFPSMLNLIDHFIFSYEDNGLPTDTRTPERIAEHIRIKGLLDNSEVWINPLANPDATYWLSSSNISVSQSRRANANGVDLNRNYPDNVGGPHSDGEVYQTETLAFMQFASDYHFVLSANFHGGIELVNYPFDNAFASTTAYHSEDPFGLGPYYTHPDTDWFEYVSVEYATHAQNDSDALGLTSYMTTDEDSYIYPSPGVTHGAEWYRVYGGRQDYINFYHQCREITMEISNVKTPPTTNTFNNKNEIIDIWYYNQEAYINFLFQGTYGFRGIVKDAATGIPIDAKITIVGRDDQTTPITNSWVETELPLGDFYRPIEAGNYDILIEADCYTPITLTNQIIFNKETIVLNNSSNPLYPNTILLSPSNTVPSGLSESNVTATTASLNWNDAGVTSYDIQYRVSGASTWTTVSSATNSLNLTGLTANTAYEFQVRSVCNANTSNYSMPALFTTLLINYCSSSGNLSSTGITNITFNSINKSDITNTNSGYEDFTSISTDLELGTSYSLSGSINTGGNGRNIYVYAWIDFNRDGDFLDSGESFNLGKIKNSSTFDTTQITVPLGAIVGESRMRVSAKYNSSPTSCETGFDGEVEDYKVNIIDGTLGVEDELLSTFLLYPNPVLDGELTIEIPMNVLDFDMVISNAIGQQLYSKSVKSNSNNSFKINTESFKPGIYFVTMSTERGKVTKKLIIQ